MHVVRPLPTTTAGSIKSEPSWDGTATSRNITNTSHHLPLRLQPAKRSSSQRVKARAADPAVLSSIIDSLDTLAPLPDIEPTDHFSDTGSRRSRNSFAESSHRSVASSASIYKAISSPGFGVEYGVGLELDDVDGLTDAALPPTVPIIRASPNTSQNTPGRLEGKNPRSASSFHPRTNSRSDSFVSTASVDSSKYKLSSESWVRRTTIKEDSLEKLKGRVSRSSRLRRVQSHEVLRSGDTQLLSPQAAKERGSTPLAEQIIANTSQQKPSSQNKGRLFLTDEPINEEPASVSVIPPMSSALPAEEQSAASRSSDHQLWVAGSSPLPTPSPIDDSIPTRTSSLRPSSNSPSRKKKPKKSKKHSTPGKSETMKQRSSSPIPESSWADLGDDDETVKRIRELREQRKSRLEESDSFAAVTNAIAKSIAVTPAKRTDVVDTTLSKLTTPYSAEVKRPSGLPKPASRHTTDSTKAQKTLGLKEEGRPPLDTGGVPLRPLRSQSEMHDGSRRTKFSLEVKRPVASQVRPSTARSVDHIQPLDLEYSYARAAKLYGDDEYRDSSVNHKDNTRLVDRSIGSQGIDSPTPGQSNSPPLKLQKPKPKRKPEDRWTAYQPDLPLTFKDRRHRRKSMSDARTPRMLDSNLELERKDSIEEAVSEYLSAPRLNRKVRVHTNGRLITYSEVGDPNGAAVFVCVGMGLTRYVTAFYDELAITLRLRLITIDRPGVGGSEPYPPGDKSGPLNWPEDVLAICQHLGIVKFSILAHSAGAIYALATALILPHLLRGRVHLLAPWVPPSQLEAISHPTSSTPPTASLPRSQRLLRVLPAQFLRAANSSFMTATSASLKPASKRTIKTNATKSPRKNHEDNATEKSPNTERPEFNRRESIMLMDQMMPAMSPSDLNLPIPVSEEEADQIKRGSLILSATASPMDPGFEYASTGLYAAEHAEKERQSEYTARLTQATWDLATRDSNPATDLLVCLERNRDVGFRYTDVGTEVVITHGSEDKRVPLANIKWLAEQMNRRALGGNLDSLSDEKESEEDWASPVKGGCEVRVLHGEGHGLMANPLIMSDILTEISAYWVGQDKGRL